MSNIQNKKQDYQIISLIGQGAYGQVYKARKKLTSQFVAIKSIKKKGKQQKDIKAMRQQIQILKKLKHENIVLLLDSFQTTSQFILVTELGQGQLFNIIEDDQFLQVEEIRKIAQQLVRALHYIHSNRITHRDMKPQNILMTSDGVIKLCDFGFARSMSYKTQLLTSLKGTPLYMAPQVVKQQPYNHTADLWSLGVILYELATSNPPFTAPNLITLVEHISKDPIMYPQTINGDFKTFLKGLLNKDPKKRLGWPQLLHHPFLKQTQVQKNQRKKKSQQFSVWIQQNVINQQQSKPTNINSKYIPGASFDQKISSNKDISPRKQNSNNNNLQCNDQAWNKFYTITADDKGSQTLRFDPKFLEGVLQVLETSINQYIRVKEKRQILQIALKSLIQVMMKSKQPQSKKLDIAKNFNIPTNLLNILKSLLKIDQGKQYIQLLSDILKLIGLLSKNTFQKSLGIQMVYIRSFLPLFPLILKSLPANKDHPSYTSNFLRTIGIFANNASANHIRSFSFYKDIVEMRFIQQSMDIVRGQTNIQVLKLYVQVLSALIHPVFGDIQCFPWKKNGKQGVLEFKEFVTMAQCVRQSIINALLQNDWIDFFQKILQLQDQSSILPKISVSRIILHSIRLSKQFSQSLICQSRSILKYLYHTLSSGDPIIYSTTCCILSQCCKYMKQKQKQSLIQKQLPFLTETILNNVKLLMMMSVKDLQKGYSFLLIGYGSFLVLYQILALNYQQNNLKILNFFTSQKCLTFITLFLSDPERNKLEEMRKIQGSNYGIHSFGLYDSAFLILHRVYSKISKQTPSTLSVLTNNLIKSKLPWQICQLITSLSSKTDISPRGLVACLIFINDLINLNIHQDFVSQSFIRNLISLLKEDQIQIIVDWPQNFGGGQTSLPIIFGNLSIIVLNLLRVSDRYPNFTKTLYDNNLIQNIIAFARFLNQSTISSVMSILSHLIVLDKNQKTQKLQRTFSYQFVECGGLSLFTRFSLLSIHIYQCSSLIQSINFLSLLARASKQFYEHIDSINPFQYLLSLLNYNDVQLKGKVLNFVGNLCRHSGYFYPKLKDNGVLQQAIKLCQDQDKVVKKFACVVIGNASFHDDTLYQTLRPTIPILINLIKDSEEKTRSNAAAALGNLARNSTFLDKDFVKNGVNFQLINLFINQKSISCKKVCVMAIMNLLSLPDSRKILQSQNIQTVLKKYIPPTYNGDAGLIKACQKCIEKLEKKVQQ